jgi:excisionase family DNA binding protein
MAAKPERASAVRDTLEPLLTYKQLAQELNIPERRLRDWTAAGIVPFFKFGYKTILFQKSRVQKALLKREVRAIEVLRR